MGKPEKYTVQQVARALTVTGGNQSEAARALGTARKVIADYLNRHPELRVLLAEINEAEVDFSEGKLKQLIAAGDKGAIIFHLKCKGKQRGWVERVEHTGKDGGPIETVDLTKLSDEELQTLRRLTAKAAA